MLEEFEKTSEAVIKTIPVAMQRNLKQKIDQIGATLGAKEMAA